MIRPTIIKTNIKGSKGLSGNILLIIEKTEVNAIHQRSTLTGQEYFVLFFIIATNGVNVPTNFQWNFFYQQTNQLYLSPYDHHDDASDILNL